MPFPVDARPGVCLWLDGSARRDGLPMVMASSERSGSCCSLVERRRRSTGFVVDGIDGVDRSELSASALCVGFCRGRPRRRVRRRASSSLVRNGSKQENQLRQDQVREQYLPQDYPH